MATTAVLLAPTAPQTYHRITSPTLRIPTDPQTPIPVGLLACQRDPLLRSIETTVVHCAISQPLLASAVKKTKKAVLAPAIPGDPLLEIILHDTVIFPEGGGQPTDTGILTMADGTVWDVAQAKRQGGHAVHYVRVGDTDVDTAIIVFSPGAKVTVALGQGDFDRRYDYMSMHTSQHLLSALLETRLSLPTLSWSLTTYPTPCYIEIPRGMNAKEITSIQDEANRLVFEGRKVHIEVEELNRDQEGGVAKLEDGRSVGKALPDDYTGGVKRVVVIDGVDRNPCCGTHLPSIHNLQLFLIPHTDALSRSTTTTARLYFLAGPRLITHITSTYSLLASTASVLSCGAPLVPARVGQVLDERKKAEKRIQDVEGELARLLAGDMVREMGKGEGVKMFKRHLHRTDDTGNALGFLSRPYLLVLSSSPSAQAISTTSIVMLLGSDDKKVKEAGDALKAKLGVKGGDKGTKWSGKFSGAWKGDAVVEDVLEASV